MTGHRYDGRPVRDIDREADAFAQLVAYQQWAASRDLVRIHERRARWAARAHWLTPLPQAAIYPRGRRS